MSTMTLTAQEKAVCACIDGFYAAWAAGDAAGAARHYTRDATAIRPGIYNRSRDEVQQLFAVAFKGRLKDTTVLDESREVRFPAEDTAIVVLEGGVLAAGETSIPADRRIRSTYVLVRQDGQWLITSFHGCPVHEN